jgi:hypothetical protein
MFHGATRIKNEFKTVLLLHIDLHTCTRLNKSSKSAVKTIFQVSQHGKYSHCVHALSVWVGRRTLQRRFAAPQKGVGRALQGNG